MPPAIRDARLLPLWLPDRTMPDERYSSFLDGEANTLHRLSRGRRQAVDLGTYRAFSAVVLSLACERVHTVDCYDGQSVAVEYADFRHSFDANLELAGRFGNITCEQDDTAEAGRKWSGGPVDVLFVDADHSEQGTIANVEAWLPHMASGGLL